MLKCAKIFLTYFLLYLTDFTTVSIQLIANAKIIIARNSLLKCIKIFEIISAFSPNNCSTPSKNAEFIILPFNNQMNVNKPSIRLVIIVTIITLWV